jgi:hypothetical protein
VSLDIARNPRLQLYGLEAWSHHHGRAEADAAVIRRHLTVAQDAEPVGLEPTYAPLEEQHLPSVDGRARHLAYGAPASPMTRGKPQRRRDLL